MLAENLKVLRKSKGYSQEEIAVRLNVVRQTVSKWEKRLLVPDTDLLIGLAELFDTPVSDLLDTKIASEAELPPVAEQLPHINEQLAVKTRRARTLWQIAATVGMALILLNILFIFAGVKTFQSYQTDGIQSSVKVMQDERSGAIIIFAE